ncbi:hypothetical protein N8083_01880 [Candidatus Pacebacteria bacterium]|nr:hypothetical protein [Candidatus Paceibacterota bacterium]
MKIKTFVLSILIFLVPTIGYAATEKEQSLRTQIEALSTYVEQILQTSNPQPLTAREMRILINNGAAFLQNAQEEDGHFGYEYAPYADHYMHGDNIVRQAGALYELGELVRKDVNRTLDLIDTIEASIMYFENLSREDTFLGYTFRCVVENQESTKCKLGATSLALTGILSYVDAYPEKEDNYKALIEDYTQYILGAKKFEGGFRNVHNIGNIGQPRAESSFSNGEAMLALVRSYQYEESVKTKFFISHAFAHIKEQEFDSGLYLWAMATLKDANQLWPNPEYVVYAKDFTQWRIKRVGRHRNTHKNYCAYVEGVASAYSVLAASSTDQELLSLRTEIDFWNTKNSLLQINDDDEFRFFLDEGRLMFRTIEDINQAKGGFLTSGEVLTERIDFTQHCISSYLQTLVDIDEETL